MKEITFHSFPTFSKLANHQIDITEAAHIWVVSMVTVYGHFILSQGFVWVLRRKSVTRLPPLSAAILWWAR